MVHRLKVPTFALGFLMLFVGSVALAPHAATAAEEIQVTGEVAGGGAFEGVIVDAEFIAYEEALVLSGHLEGVVTVDGVETEISQQFDEFATASQRSSCKTIYYVVAPIFVEAIGDEIQLDEIAMEQPPTGLLGGLLGGCTLKGLLDGSSGDNADLADLLNDILGN